MTTWRRLLPDPSFFIAEGFQGTINIAGDDDEATCP